MSFLPVSTSALLSSTQLGFTDVFAFFIVKQKLSASSINVVVLLTFGTVVLGVHASGDRPNGESKAKYNIGFPMTLGATVVYALVLQLVELMYKYAKEDAIGREAKHYRLGQAEYYLVDFFSTIIAHFFFLGLVGTIKYSSALLSGVIVAICIPVTEVHAVFFFH
ncbi:Purine permease 3 [Platanthera guangdongensis]|uniref:Purine permease 3 n=1 Tax=Platanthera guangdongensis TaxID=2320717 RepID=A0ABR2MYM7_9ASPA